MEAILSSIASSAAVEIAKAVVLPIGRQFGYIVYCNTKIDDLRVELQKLVDKKTTEVDPLVVNAARNLENTIASVVKWQKSVDDVNGAAIEFLDRAISRNNSCLNPVSRYRLGRKAAKTTTKVVILIQEAAQWSFLNQIAIPAPPPTVGSTLHAAGVKFFDSRRWIEDEIWKALKDDNLRLIGVCGIAGVGKTTLVNMLIKRAGSENLFGEFAKTAVSQNPDLSKIQDEFAEQLGLNFGKLGLKTLPAKSSKLHERIIKSDKRVLVILDDVWKELNFEAIGLPPSTSEEAKCKIILTSRFEHVCSKMRSEKNFKIDVLGDEEAWSLFKEMVGNSVDPNLHQTARDISNKCKGLPIAIVTLAKALNYKPKEIWDDVLLQLRNPNQESNPDMQEDVYSHLEISYNLIRRKNAQLCFLLCCLYPEDYNVPIEDLVRYGVGLGWFKGLHTIQQARTRVHALVQELKESFLLMEGDSPQYESVKMHDLVRDVAIRIASKDPHRYIVSCDAKMKMWPDQDIENYRECSAISLMRREIDEHPGKLVCPKLQLLHIAYHYGCQFLPNNVFEEMNEVKVVSLKIPLMLQPLDVLKKLRMLRLHNIESGQISIIGSLVCLQILDLGSSNIRELPEEIGLLKNLRLLDLRHMNSLLYIPSGVLSRLFKLEEFYVRYFGSTEDGSTNACLHEIESHPITTLRIGLKDLSVWPKELVFMNLERFCISTRTAAPKNDSKNELYLYGDAREIKKSGICILFRKTEILDLDLVTNLKNIGYELDDNGFPHLEMMSANFCDKLECLVDATKWSQLRNNDSIHNRPCFNNLRDIRIEACSELKYLFPLSVAGGLKQICNMDIKYSRKMEVFFYREEEEEEKVTTSNELLFSELKTLKLDHCDKIKTVAGPLETSIMSCKEKSMKIECCLFSLHWLQLKNLQMLELIDCNSLKVVFRPPVAQQLVQLIKLCILRCKQLQYIIAEEEEEEEEKDNTKIVFPMLVTLYFDNLPELAALCAQNYLSFEFPSLKDIKWEQCPKLETLGTASSTNRSKEMSPRQQENVQENKSDDHPTCSGDQLHQEKMKMIKMEHCLISSHWLKLQNLQMLELCGLDSLKVVFRPSIAQQLLQLRKLRIVSFKQLRYIIAEEGNDNNRGITKILFPMLLTLYFADLPELAAFCSDDHISIELPSLKDIEWRNCAKLEAFCPPKLPAPSTFKHPTSREDQLQQVSKSKKTLSPIPFSRILRRRRLQESIQKDTYGITQTKYPAPSENQSQQLSLMNKNSSVLVYDHKDSCGVLSSKLIEGMSNLQKIRTRSSLASKVLFSLEQDWFKTPQEITVFQNLRVLEIEFFTRLLHLMSAGSCRDKEESSKPRIVFPQLHTLTLNWLPSLRSFCIDVTVELPLLETLTLSGCNQMGTFCYGGSVITPKLKEIVINQNNYHLKKDLNVMLEEVMLSGELALRDSVTPSPYVDPSKFKSLVVEYCKTLSTANIPSSARTEKLTVSSCDSIIEIFDFEGMNNISAAFSHLQDMFLGGLPKLENIFKKIPENVVAFENLTTLRIQNCASLKYIFSVSLAKRLQLQVLDIKNCQLLKQIIEDEEQGEGSSKDIIMFPQLRSLKLRELPEFISICSGAYSFEFPSLQDLEVFICDNLRNVLSVSAARGLPQLQRLYIRHCNGLKEVIVVEEDSEQEDDKIRFPQLKSMRLELLYELTSFCNGTSTLEFPLLESLSLEKCHEMKTFSQGSVIIPKLDNVDVGWRQECCPLIGDRDLNAAVSQLYKPR